MKKIILVFFIFIVSAAGVAAQTETELSSTPVPQFLPEGFQSDGCSLFPNGDYLDCCVQHDLKYFKGGSWTARWRADNQLRKCIESKNGWWHKPLAPIMWMGVRIGGLPFLPTPFRWGFGKVRQKLTLSPRKEAPK